MGYKFLYLVETERFVNFIMIMVKLENVGCGVFAVTKLHVSITNDCI